MTLTYIIPKKWSQKKGFLETSFKFECNPKDNEGYIMMPGRLTDKH